MYILNVCIYESTVTVLFQDMTYFDDPAHSTGALCTKLSSDASSVQEATGAQLGLFVRCISSLFGGLCIGLVYSWKLTFVFLAFTPFIVAAGFLKMSLMKGSAQADKDALESAGKVNANHEIFAVRFLQILKLEMRS